MSLFCLPVAAVVAAVGLFALLVPAPAGATIGRPPAFLPPVSAGGDLIVAYRSWDAGRSSHVTSVACCDGETGELRWVKQFPDTYLQGRLVAYAGSVMVNLSGRVHVLDVSDGTLRAVLGDESSWYGDQRYAQGRIVLLIVSRREVGDNIRHPSGYAVAAFDAATFHKIWQQDFGEQGLRGLSVQSDGDEIEVLLEASRRPRVEHVGGRVKVTYFCEKVTLSADDGSVTSREPPKEWHPEAIIPDTLPPATQAWLKELLGGEEGRAISFTDRTDIIEVAGLLFVGKLDVRAGSRTLFAIRPLSAQVVWEAPVEELAHIALHGDRLIVAYGPRVSSVRARGQRGLIAVDPCTRRVLWRTVLPRVVVNRR